MDELQGLSIELQHAYPELKKHELRDEVLKQVMREKVEAAGMDRYSYESIVMKFKKHTNWKWKDEFMESLHEEAKLPLAVTVNKRMEKRFDLEAFRVDNGQHIRFYPTRSKVQTELKKIEKEALEIELSSLSLDDLVIEFKLNKMDLQSAEETYSTLKQRLFTLLTDKHADSFGCGTLGKFKIQPNDPTYDVLSIQQASVTKHVSFLYKVVEEETLVHDLYNGARFSFVHSTPYEEHILTSDSRRLYIDGQPLQVFDGLAAMKPKMRKEYQAFVDEGFVFVEGAITIEGEDFFRHCPLSSTKVTDLMNQGLVDPKALEKYRYIESLDDVDIRFEVIDEETEADRKVFFFDQLIQRSETIRERNNTVITV